MKKTALAVANRAAKMKVSTTLISGAIDRDALPLLTHRFAGCFSITDGPMSLQDCIANAGRLLADRSEQIARLVAANLIIRIS